MPMNHYSSSNDEIARQVLEHMDNYSRTDEGAALLEEAGIQRVLIRGSGGYLLSEEPMSLRRSVGDLDFLTCGDPRKMPHWERIAERMEAFISGALEGTALSYILKDRDLMNNLEKELRPTDIFYVAPRTSFAQGNEPSPREALRIEVSYYCTLPDLPPETKEGDPIELSSPGGNLTCLENIYERLAHKIASLSNTPRHQLETEEEGSQKKTLDILDAYNLFHVAKARCGSTKEVLKQLEGIYQTSGNRFNYMNMLEDFNAGLHERRKYLEASEHGTRQPERKPTSNTMLNDLLARRAINSQLAESIPLMQEEGRITFAAEPDPKAIMDCVSGLMAHQKSNSSQPTLRSRGK